MKLGRMQDPLYKDSYLGLPQLPSSCPFAPLERLTVAWLFLGSLAVLIYAGDSFLAVQLAGTLGNFKISLMVPIHK